MKTDDDLFDLTMKACNGTEVWEIIEIFLLENISEKYNKKTSVHVGITGYWHSTTRLAYNWKE